MTATGYAHIDFKPNGTPMIAGTRISVARIALDHTLHGESPDQIVENYEGLTLGQVYGALTYYYDHKEEMDRRIEEDKTEIEVRRAEWRAANAELIARLKARRKQP